MQQTQMSSLDREDPLEKGMAAHPSILARSIPWTEEPGRLQCMGCKESDMTELLSIVCPVSQVWSISGLVFPENELPPLLPLGWIIWMGPM